MKPRNRALPLCSTPARELTDRELVKMLCAFIGTFSGAADAAASSGPRFAGYATMKNALLWIGDHLAEVLVAWQMPAHDGQRVRFSEYLFQIDKVLDRTVDLDKGELTAGACWEALLPELVAAAEIRVALEGDSPPDG